MNIKNYLNKEQWIIHIQSLETKNLQIYFEKYLEEEVPSYYLIQLLHLNQEVKESILKDKNTFKWTCAYGDTILLEELWKEKVVYDEFNAVQACIINSRFNNLCFLEEKGFDLYTDYHLNELLSRGLQNNYDFRILIKYLKKIPDIELFSSTIEKMKDSYLINMPQIYKEEDIVLNIFNLFKKDGLTKKKQEIYQNVFNFGNKKICQLLMEKNKEEAESFFSHFLNMKSISFSYDYFYNHENYKDFNDILDYFLDKKLIKYQDIPIENLIHIIKENKELTHRIIQNKNISKNILKKILDDYHSWDDVIDILKNPKFLKLYRKMNEKDQIDIFNKIFEIKIHSSSIVEASYQKISSFFCKYFKNISNGENIFDSNIKKIIKIENKKNYLYKELKEPSKIIKKIKI